MAVLGVQGERSPLFPRGQDSQQGTCLHAAMEKVTRVFSKIRGRDFVLGVLGIGTIISLMLTLCVSVAYFPVFFVCFVLGAWLIVRSADSNTEKR